MAAMLQFYNKQIFGKIPTSIPIASNSISEYLKKSFYTHLNLSKKSFT